MKKFKQLFKAKCSVIGMIHLKALPGTPRTTVTLATNAAPLTDALLVENMNDIPYIQRKHMRPETTAVMSRVCTELRKLCNKPCGLQVLAGGNLEAVAIASACGFNFIRSEGYVFSHVADEGFTDADAGVLLRYRRSIGAEDVLVFTDIKKKHSSHAITSDVDVVETAKAAEFFLSDGVILTGLSTGKAADVAELINVKNNIEIPVLIGSGVTANNIEDYLSADAVIVGSAFKVGGSWKNDIDVKNVRMFMEKINGLP